MPETPDLFPDDPIPARPGSMMERLAMPGAKLTPTQRAFQQKVAQIEAVEGRLRDTGLLREVFGPLFTKKMQPLQEEYDALNREMVLFLDVQLARKGWTANQRKTMREIVCTIAPTLFDGPHGEEMEALFDRHSDVSAADQAVAEQREMAQDIEEMFGIELDADAVDANNPEALLREVMRQMEADELARVQAAEARAADKRARRKSAGVTKAEQQAIDAGKLLKEIYRKLTSALHPDREPDADERTRKTRLMSEVNKAYDEGNLLKLLQLQVEAVKVDPRAAASMADEQLRVINHRLGEQLRDLQLECRELETLVRAEFHLAPFDALSAPALQKALNAHAAAARAENKVMRQDLAQIRLGDTNFKPWLKSQRELMSENARLEQALAEFIMPRSRRRR